jgi:hypothetical protein
MASKTHSALSQEDEMTVRALSITSSHLALKMAKNLTNLKSYLILIQ